MAGVAFSSEASTDESESFEKASSKSSQSAQMKLLGYSRRRPGRLASRMLLCMEKATASRQPLGGGGSRQQSALSGTKPYADRDVPITGRQAGDEVTERDEDLGPHPRHDGQGRDESSSRCTGSEDQSSGESDPREQRNSWSCWSRGSSSLLLRRILVGSLSLTPLLSNLC